MAGERYTWVAGGAITPPPPGAVIAGGRAQTRNPFQRPSAVGAIRIGPAMDDDALAALHVWRVLISERGPAPGLAYVAVTAAPAVDLAAQRVRVVESWRAMTSPELAAAVTAARTAKLAELAAEAERRLAAVNDWVRSIDAYLVLEALILTIRAEARAPIPALLTRIKAVADAGRAARTAIGALTTLEAIAAYNVASDPNWP
jgi:hypothetical protein